MGSLQPGLPSPTMIPHNWNIILVDLKDCFFTIPLHPKDAPRFAFSVPKINKSEPMDRCHWTVLPLGMKNSPTVCQMYVAKVLAPIRKQYPETYIYHYMDDMLVAVPTESLTHEIIQRLRQELQTWGLQIAPEKIQVEAPWKYLGWKILQQTVQPQAITITQEVKTLNDLQKLIGNINRIQNYCGINNQILSPLFDLLKGDNDINVPRQLTKEAKTALSHIEGELMKQQCHRQAEGLPIQLYLCNQDPQPLALVADWDPNAPDPLLLLEWVFLPHQPTKTLATRVEMFAALIKRGRERIVEIAGIEPETIIIPIVKEYLDWEKNGQWQHTIDMVQGSPQIVELHAIIMAFKNWSNEPLNIVADSQYAVGVVQRIERAQIRPIQNEMLFLKFKELVFLVERRLYPYCVIHVHSHTVLPGVFTEGNARADLLTNLAIQPPDPNKLLQACTSIQLFHQPARPLAKQVSIPLGDAKLIVQTCPDCQQLQRPSKEVNPKGLSSLQLWQADVTHVPEFGRLKYAHISIDTFSHAVWATPLSWETSRHVQAHFCLAFAALGIPLEIKTNGPAYVSSSMKKFFHTWGITYKTAIPHSLTGQVIAERTHRTVKSLLEKKREKMETPQNRIAKVLYVMNHLTMPFSHEEVSPTVKHFGAQKTGLTSLYEERPLVEKRNLNTGAWEGPYSLITWGRGYVCVSTEGGPKWIPARAV